ncbi:unnamed protein product [Rhizophagus irregularis]|uniref:Uncharacterized protein n=1 Tax=Rhizophagus irregularis TaxID=588596 RepID=A0A915YSE1_9GLOM|nr:unnamed protein product [Rhizophagus irregularis]CAB5323161.1 unnamed protein product [Rhizophagus irregularis]
MEDNWSADKQKEHGTYTKTLGKIAGSESSEYRSMAVSALKIFPEILNTRAINNSKEKYLDHLEESTYEVLDDTRSYVVADVKAETGKRKSARSEIPTRYDRNKSSEGQNIVIESGHDEQKQTKRVRFHEEKPPSKKKSKSGKRSDTLLDGTKITKPSPINYAEGDETDDGIPSNEANDYSDDDEEALPPEDSLSFALSNSKVWTLPSGKNVERLRTMLRVPEMTGEESSFVLKVEDMVYKGHVSQAYKYCTEIHSSSIEDSYLYKISKIYGDFIYKSKDQEDILDFTTKGAHTEVDVILKACAYIVDGLNKSLTIYPRWGESFCPLSRSADYINGRKCDVRFMTILGVDVGEWEFSAKATATKTIGDRCRSARINQSILNGLLEYNLDDNQVKDIRVPFLQFAGTNGQLLIEDLMEGFYVVLPGPKFDLPTKLKSIGKLKTCIGVIKLVMEMYVKTCKTIENVETSHTDFDDIFDVDDTVKSITHNKYNHICKPWWTPKKSNNP